MFRQIRWRLVAWSMLVLGVILVVLGAALYTAVSRSLLDQVDRNLASRSDQAGPVFEGMTRGGPPPDREGYRGGVFYLLLAPDGTVIANPQRLNVDGIEITRPTDRSGAYATVDLDGEPIRVYARLIGGPRAPPGTVLVIGQSLEAEQNALNSLLFVLIGGGALGLLLSLGGAWFLAGRALIPIEQAFRRQQEFVADASHELRTPLTVLRSATDLLNEHRAEPIEANGELFDDIRAEITRLQRLSGDLLTLARSDRGELELAVAEVNLADLAAEVVRRTEPLATQRGISLAFNAVDGSPVVEADPDRIQQVLLILLDNAIKYTPPGGKVEVQVGLRGLDAYIQVADTGVGIAPQHLPRVFDRFYRADAARSRSEGATGLGLAIAKTLVDAHGGTTVLSSTLGVGTRVTVSLRAVAGAAQASRLRGLAGRLSHALDSQEPSPEVAAGPHATNPVILSEAKDRPADPSLRSG